MTKEKIINELNVCGFTDQSVLNVLSERAEGALWMQKRIKGKLMDLFCISNCGAKRKAGCCIGCRQYEAFEKGLKEI